jgi:hypothetical protein
VRHRTSVRAGLARPVLEGRARRLVLAAVGLGLAAPASAGPVALSAVSAYGTLEAGGVVAAVTGDTEQNARAHLEWRLVGQPQFRPGHPLARIGPGAFAGSLFWLQPGTAYEVRVTLTDPDGVAGPATATTAFQTRSAVLAEPPSPARRPARRCAPSSARPTSPRPATWC